MSAPSSRPERTRRTRWHWLVGGAIGAVLAVGLSIAVWSFTGDGSGDGGDHETVWLFGFSTVRVDPTGGHQTHQLDVRGFGSVAGAEGGVFMYDPANGRVGVLDATTDELRERDRLAPWSAGEHDGVVAVSSRRLWLVTGPGEVTRLDRSSLDVVGTTDVDPSAKGTWLAAEDRSAFVAVDRGRTLELARLDEDGKVVANAEATDPGKLGAVQSIEASPDLVWVVGERGARAFATEDLKGRGTVGVSAQAGAVRAAVAFGQDLWIVADDGGVAYRIRLDGTAQPVALLTTPPATFRGQVDLAAGTDAVYALAPTGTTPDDRSAVVHRIDPHKAAVTDSLQAPSALFAGAIAVTD